MNLEELYDEWDEYKSKWSHINFILICGVYSVFMFSLFTFCISALNINDIYNISIGVVIGILFYFTIQQYYFNQKIESIINKNLEKNEKDDK